MPNSNNLAILGAALYICEGTRLRVARNRPIYSIEFTNKDVALIRAFLEFLRKIIVADENRIKAQLFYYPDHNLEKLKIYWSKATNIPSVRFTKPIALIQKNVRYKPNPLGTLKIRYHHKKHFLKLQGIIGTVFDKYNYGEVA